MAKQKSSKIFVKNNDHIQVLMWAIVGPDGSVMMGFPWESKQVLELVMDKELGHIGKDDLVTEEYTGNSKISFHRSGQFKLSCRMGKDEDAIDRVTVNGPSFDEIESPYRMSELLLPRELPESNYVPTERDIIIDITGSEGPPTRCTISCMSNEEFIKLSKQKGKFVDTSIWEASNGLETDSHTWFWTLRKSKEDKRFSDKVYVTLLGSPKWGVG